MKRPVFETWKATASQGILGIGTNVTKIISLGIPTKSPNLPFFGSIMSMGN